MAASLGPSFMKKGETQVEGSLGNWTEYSSHCQAHVLRI